MRSQKKGTLTIRSNLDLDLLQIQFFFVPNCYLRSIRLWRPSRMQICTQATFRIRPQEEKKALKNEAGNWAHTYPYNRVARAAIRKKNGVKVYYIHWSPMRIWYTAREMRSTVPQTILKASELNSGIDRPWLVNCKYFFLILIFPSCTINLIHFLNS